MEREVCIICGQHEPPRGCGTCIECQKQAKEEEELEFRRWQEIDRRIDIARGK
jgi:hypothetical protein